MITPSFSLTATERVLPKLALDFTTASLDSRITFTRTTGASNPATYTNSSGVVTAATNNQPRFDYDPIALTCKGLLIEESRTNAQTYSSDYSQAAWTKTEITLGASAVSPDGTSNATKIIPSTNLAAHWLRNLTSVVTGTTYTQTVYAKAGEYSVVQLALSSGFTSTYFQNFDLSDGTLGSSSGITGTIFAMGGGWYRCSVSGPAINSISGGIIIAVVPAKTSARLATFAGNGTDGLYIWGAQFEQGAFATSYIPTTTAALTRNTDVATMTGTNFSNWYNQSEGALSCEFAFIGYDLANRDRIVSISDSTGNEEIGIIQNSTNGYGRFEVVDGGSNQALLNCINTTMVAGTTYQICGTYKLNSFCGSGSLGSQATDASGTIPTPDRMCIGGNGPGTTTAIFNGHVKSINYWPQRITNNETLAFAKI
jgi:hypothetical protein